MKALFVSSDPSLFDPESPARARARAYAGAIGTLFMVSRGTGAQVREYGKGLQEGGLFLYAVGGGKLGALKRLEKLTKKLIAEQGVEIVSAQDPFEHGFIAARAVKGTKVKLHIQVHTDFCSPWFVVGKSPRSIARPMPFLNKVRLMIADRVLPQADGVRAVSERVKASLVARYGTRIHEPEVIPITVATELPAKVALPLNAATFAFVTIGRLEREKRIEDILVALRSIKDRYPSVGLVIIGDGRERARLEKLSATLGLNERVLFLGWRTDAKGLMQSAHTYIQASGYEGYGMTLIEAALARIPIITTDVGIVGEVFSGYDDVLSAPPGDPAALAVHMVGIIEDVTARKSLTMHAEQKVLAHLARYPDQPSMIAANLGKAFIPV